MAVDNFSLPYLTLFPFPLPFPPLLVILTPYPFIFPLVQQAHKKKTNLLCRRTQEDVEVKVERSPTARSHKESDQSKQGIHPSLIASSSSPSNSPPPLATPVPQLILEAVAKASEVECKGDYGQLAGHDAPP